MTSLVEMFSSTRRGLFARRGDILVVQDSVVSNDVRLSHEVKDECDIEWWVFTL